MLFHRIFEAILNDKTSLDLNDRIFILNLLVSLSHSEDMGLIDYLGHTISGKNLEQHTVPVFATYCHLVHNLISKALLENLGRNLTSNFIIDIEDIFLDNAIMSLGSIYSSSALSPYFLQISIKQREIFEVLLLSERVAGSISIRRRTYINLALFFDKLLSVSSSLRPSLNSIIEILQKQHHGRRSYCSQNSTC